MARGAAWTHRQLGRNKFIDGDGTDRERATAESGQKTERFVRIPGMGWLAGSGKNSTTRDTLHLGALDSMLCVLTAALGIYNFPSYLSGYIFPPFGVLDYNLGVFLYVFLFPLQCCEYGHRWAFASVYEMGLRNAFNGRLVPLFLCCVWCC